MLLFQRLAVAQGGRSDPGFTICLARFPELGLLGSRQQQEPAPSGNWAFGNVIACDLRLPRYITLDLSGCSSNSSNYVNLGKLNLRCFLFLKTEIQFQFSLSCVSPQFFTTTFQMLRPTLCSSDICFRTSSTLPNTFERSCERCQPNTFASCAKPYKFNIFQQVRTLKRCAWLSHFGILGNNFPWSQDDVRMLPRLNDCFDHSLSITLGRCLAHVWQRLLDLCFT